MRINMSMGSNNNAGFWQNKRCKCGKKAAVYISESEKNPGRLYFKCVDKICDYYVRRVVPSRNASNIQRRSKAIHIKNEDERGYDYDFEKNNVTTACRTCIWIVKLTLWVFICAYF
ncbi:uncharacterized protein LOC114284256 [Camellia sinensis]|uniref:uncharacterized protein LOC114284256 n=1 Tax=Camellia sinensis TaxID=4442 RepID=UPI001035830E|nr:uncharacterized protein LOC114284256 [Camellia sinensis]